MKMEVKGLAGSAGLTDLGTTVPEVPRRRFNLLQLYSGNRDVFKRFPTAAAQGTAA